MEEEQSSEVASSSMMESIHQLSGLTRVSIATPLKRIFGLPILARSERRKRKHLQT